MADALIYAPKKFQGLGLKLPYIKQGIDKILFWLQERDRKNLGERLLHQTYEDMQLEVGSTQPFFSLSYKKYKKATTESWVKDLWKCLFEHKIEIRGSFPTIKTMREKDRCIMDVLSNDRINTSSVLAACNRCRLYLQISTISEMSNGDGTNIRADIMDVIKHEMIPNIYKWPNQHRPSLEDRKTWKDAIMRSLHLQSPSNRLPIQMG